VQSIPGQSFHVVAEVSEGGASFGRTFKVTVSVDGVSCGELCSFVLQRIYDSIAIELCSVEFVRNCG
jgi:hypothetical protein